MTTPSPSNFFDNVEDWQSWKPSPDVAEAFPYYRMGYDYEGLVGKTMNGRLIVSAGIIV